MNSAKVIEMLMKACVSLMDEVSQIKVTDWGIVNDAMIEGQRYLIANQKINQKERKND